MRNASLTRLPRQSVRAGKFMQNRLRTRSPLLKTTAIGAIGALMNRVRQPHTLLVLGLNAEMGTTAGADELVEIPAQKILTCLAGESTFGDPFQDSGVVPGGDVCIH